MEGRTLLPTESLAELFGAGDSRLPFGSLVKACALTTQLIAVLEAFARCLIAASVLFLCSVQPQDLDMMGKKDEDALEMVEAGGGGSRIGGGYSSGANEARIV